MVLKVLLVVAEGVRMGSTFTRFSERKAAVDEISPSTGGLAGGTRVSLSREGWKAFFPFADAFGWMA